MKDMISVCLKRTNMMIFMFMGLQMFHSTYTILYRSVFPTDVKLSHIKSDIFHKHLLQPTNFCKLFARYHISLDTRQTMYGNALLHTQVNNFRMPCITKHSAVKKAVQYETSCSEECTYCSMKCAVQCRMHVGKMR